jgi:hypothetical protein
MLTYKLNAPTPPDTTPTSVTRSDGWCVNLKTDHRFVRQFLQDWKDGAEVLDADGNPLPYSDEALAALEVK